MILAIDIGNTNIVIGCMEEKKCIFIERLSTVRTKTELEYAIDIKNVLDIYHIKKSDLAGGIISSVVPQITAAVKLAVEKIIKKEPLVVGAGIKTGLNIRMDHPAQLGSDLVADSVGALSEYPAPLVIFDLGTANTVCVIDRDRNYVGGMIYPGIVVSLDSLVSRAAQLGGISLEAPEHIIGKKYDGVYEEWDYLQLRGSYRRDHRPAVRGAWRSRNRGGYGRSGEKYCSSLQERDHCG